ncbi:MAG: hypothetical protein EPN25_10900 [Nitrospirae bacterium]|nr:MAG: hypothetical protein EPN25_10900 [Nitrospirota bacterium]
MKRLKTLSVTAVLLSLAGGGMAASPPGAGFTEGPGVELLQKKCTLCHDPDHITSLRQTREEWEDTVGIMIRRGAPVSAGEASIIVEYLTKHYGRQK